MTFNLKQVIISVINKEYALSVYAALLIIFFQNFGGTQMNNNNLVRFLLTFFLGWIGSIIINHSSLKPEGYTSRTLAYIFLTMITFGIYGLVASICNLTFDPAKDRNIGYKKD